MAEAKKKATKAKISQEDIERELIALDRVTNALNTAIVALYYIVGVKGDELDKVKVEDYVKFVQEHIHPVVRRADELAKELADKTAEEAKKAVEE
jgi:CO dehydrogenase/acetyl-CoA synthase beta subunit